MLVQERMRGPHGRGTVGVRVSETWGEGYGTQELRGEGVTVSGVTSQLATLANRSQKQI
jgi:hypothetical protein